MHRTAIVVVLSLSAGPLLADGTLLSPSLLGQTAQDDPLYPERLYLGGTGASDGAGIRLGLVQRPGRVRADRNDVREVPDTGLNLAWRSQYGEVAVDILPGLQHDRDDSASLSLRVPLFQARESWRVWAGLGMEWSAGEADAGSESLERHDENGVATRVGVSTEYRLSPHWHARGGVLSRSPGNPLDAALTTEGRDYFFFSGLGLHF